MRIPYSSHPHQRLVLLVFLVLAITHHHHMGLPESSVATESACNAGGPDSWVRKIHWRRYRLPTPVLGFPCGSAGKESTCNAGDLGLIPGLGGSPGERNGNPLQDSNLENSMDRGAWQVTVHGVAKSQTQLSDFHFSDLKLKCYSR